MLNSPLEGAGTTAPAPFTDEQAEADFMAAYSAQAGA